MFNALSADRLVSLLSNTLRESERWPRPLDEFQKSQLKSASSIGRYLSIELAMGGPPIVRCRERVVHLLDSTISATQVDGEADSRALLDAMLTARPAVKAAVTGAELGQSICDLLVTARSSTEACASLVEGIHTAIRELVDAEIHILGNGGRADAVANDDPTNMAKGPE